MNILKLLLCIALATTPLYGAIASNPAPDPRFKADLLVVVAHPDDETEIGAYLARAVFDEHKRVAVVFGNRGNQGGNAMGQEQDRALAAIRTIEAREAVGFFGIKNVWFLNGTDTPSQDVLFSLETWGHGEALDRMVRIIRLTRPTVVATWLPHIVGGEDHGDHQAAGVIATEAFDLAGNPAAFPEQLSTPLDSEGISNLTEGLRPWQPEKLYYFTDAVDQSFTKGKGPIYSATAISPSRHVSYARLQAKEASFHLTQGDTGQAAAEALRSGDLQGFSYPSRFILGKSYVPSSITGDLFQGTVPGGIPYHRPPGYVPQPEKAASIQLGGPWRFYRIFWPAHGIENLASLLPGPEIMYYPGSRVAIPITMLNPEDLTLPVTLSITLPAGWQATGQPPLQFSLAPHSQYSFSVQAKTPSDPTQQWEHVVITAKSGSATIGTVRLSVKLDRGAMGGMM